MRVRTQRAPTREALVACDHWLIMDGKLGDCQAEGLALAPRVQHRIARTDKVVLLDGAVVEVDDVRRARAVERVASGVGKEPPGLPQVLAAKVVRRQKEKVDLGMGRRHVEHHIVGDCGARDAQSDR